MAKKLKKGQKGASSMFLSRAKAIKKLSIPIRDFRKLCIYKGIFPRIPPNKLKSTQKTYYHSKDINYLAQDRLMDHFRAVNALRKKLQTASIANDKKTTARLRARMPRLNLDKVVKERYPSFELAVRDLDDPLSLIALVASVATHRLFKISPLRVALSTKLLRFFKAYAAKKGLLRKVFLTTKGVYYQVELRQSSITWVEPYAFTTVLPFDVDYKVILSFLEFYLVLVKFVVFKLYAGAGLSYPPVEVAQSGTLAGEGVFCGLELQRAAEEEPASIDPEFAAQIAGQTSGASKPLFKGLVFFLSREVDKGIFEFAVTSFGGRAVWDLANFDSELYRTEEITHVVADRALDTAEHSPNREYVQPQWICDCINFAALLPVSDYAPGKPLPPHLSPFVQDKEEGYVPQRKKQVLEMLGGYAEEELDEEETAPVPSIEHPEFVGRAEPMVVVDEGAEASKTSKHGKFQPTSTQSHQIRRTNFSEEQERQKDLLEQKLARQESTSNQVLSLNRKRRRLLNKISAAESLKRERAQELTRRARQL